MTDYIEIVAGTILPFIAQKFEKYLPESKTLKYIAVQILCFIFSIVILALQGDLQWTFEAIFPALAKVSITAQLVYTRFIKK